MCRPTIEFDDANHVMTISGNKYSYEFFEMMGEHGMGVGQITQATEVEPGTITLTRRYDLEEAERRNSMEAVPADAAGRRSSWSTRRPNTSRTSGSPGTSSWRTWRLAKSQSIRTRI